MPNFTKVFNDHFMEFVDDIIRVFPDDVELATAKNMFLVIKKTNPKLIIKSFDKYVFSKYKNEIMNGDIDYFLEKDYSQDLKSNSNATKILQSIDRLRNPIKQMKKEDKDKVILYIKNLLNVSEVYFNINKNERETY